MLANDADEIEPCAVRTVCLVASEYGSAWSGTDAGVAQDLQLHPAVAVHGMTVEGVADRKEC